MAPDGERWRVIAGCRLSDKLPEGESSWSALSGSALWVPEVVAGLEKSWMSCDCGSDVAAGALIKCNCSHVETVSVLCWEPIRCSHCTDLFIN